ncbi:hypothetical protein COCC4DRAFT_152968 [Bipolaris maydis ATCC 48331]|uniref:Uncharacterized protein n=2 Tax=Cochliobolus heterostrophus TaxID=5016 RepID=M2TVE8_COCH5|nr:uncharacterized protein COCC4DRAFT_152968 [Bipolaris maydis ATCC 48331]EMD85731.1 hypothetical protein COCHEDRAFT_1161141 [Bipolaris maydis C5]ENH99600.1 hypothetical protein COCC4DRAFT_152968 [Bipolaris maydis ATCC 48331]
MVGIPYLSAKCKISNVAIKTMALSTCIRQDFAMSCAISDIRLQRTGIPSVFLPSKMRHCEACCDGGDFLGTISGGSNLSQNGKRSSTRHLARH